MKVFITSYPDNRYKIEVTVNGKLVASRIAENIEELIEITTDFLRYFSR